MTASLLSRIISIIAANPLEAALEQRKKPPPNGSGLRQHSDWSVPTYLRRNSCLL